MELKEFEVGLGQMFEDGSPVVIAVDENNNPRLLGKEKVYIKSEADAVIAHNKYKRCLAMARMCEERSARYDALQERHDLDWGREIEFYYKWYMRWLELARKFNTNSTAQ